MSLKLKRVPLNKYNCEKCRQTCPSEKNSPLVEAGLVDFERHGVAGEVRQVESRRHGNQASGSLQDGQQPLRGSAHTVWCLGRADTLYFGRNEGAQCLHLTDLLLCEQQRALQRSSQFSHSVQTLQRHWSITSWHETDAKEVNRSDAQRKKSTQQRAKMVSLQQ